MHALEGYSSHFVRLSIKYNRSQKVVVQKVDVAKHSTNAHPPLPAKMLSIPKIFVHNIFLTCNRIHILRSSEDLACSGSLGFGKYLYSRLGRTSNDDVRFLIRILISFSSAHFLCRCDTLTTPFSLSKFASNGASTCNTFQFL